MNQEQVTGMLRAIVPAILSYCVAKGWITQSMVGEITAAVITLAAAGWSVHNNSQSAMVATVNAMPEVKGVITANTEAGKDLAAAVPSATVVPAGSTDAAAVAR